MDLTDFNCNYLNKLLNITEQKLNISKEQNLLPVTDLYLSFYNQPE